MPTLVIHSTDVEPALLEQLESELQTRPEFRRHSVRFSSRHSPDISTLRQVTPYDINLIPDAFDINRVGMIISDMDSTLITIECIDEIAAHAGLKDKVSAITEAAMQGQLNFAESLQRRVALLRGVPVDALRVVYNDRLRLNPGAEALVKAAQQRNIPFFLVSGGFTFFTERLMARLGLTGAIANQLEVSGGKLTGKLNGSIVDATAKADYLLARCKQLNLDTSQVLAIGDGANDLEMMDIAGLGVAYRAKPAVQQRADCVLNFSGLDGVLELLNWSG